MDAYLPILITDSHHMFLRFIFQEEHWQFKVLPFSLKYALRVVTKGLFPVVAQDTSLSILDDCMLQQRTKYRGFESRYKKLTLIQLGVVFNFPKYQLTPTQGLIFIGAQFCMDLSRVFLPVQGIGQLQSVLQD